jgi:hypothetical protein
MDEQSLFLLEIAERLGGAGIPYMLTGSVALAIYAAPRMTRDIDIVIDIGADDAGRVVALFEGDCYIDRDDTYEAARRRVMFNAIHKESLLKIDFIVRKDEPYREAEFQRRRPIDIEGTAIAVVAPEDLFLSKLCRARGSQSELHLRDAKALAGSVRDLDWKYILDWALKLGVRELAERAREK